MASTKHIILLFLPAAAQKRKILVQLCPQVLSLFLRPDSNLTMKQRSLRAPILAGIFVSNAAAFAPPVKNNGVGATKRLAVKSVTNEDSYSGIVDRREAGFAILATLVSTALVPAGPAIAAYGDDAKMEMPNPLDQVLERQNKQCLMESLGTRQCLVYEDPDNKLYQNPDTKALVERVEKSGEALATIPELIEGKQWIKITGVLTGPMGTLSNSMDLLSKASDNPSANADRAKRVKNDLYGISGAVDRRNGGSALEYHKLATEHLVEFLKSLE